MEPVGVGLVGCGFVADLYLGTLSDHPELRVLGVADHDPDRLAAFTAHHSVRGHADLDGLLADPAIELILVLADPASHADLIERALRADRHVYSEKPLALELGTATALVQLAADRDRWLASAPNGVLGEAAGLMDDAIRAGRIGEPRLVHAEIDDGMVPAMPYRRWRSDSGAPWPYRHEFETGCVLEHAGYTVTWLADTFGPVAAVTAWADCLLPDKVPGEPPLHPPDTPDTAVAVLEHLDGPPVRLTASIVAPVDHSLTVIGDEGVLTVADTWDLDTAVRIRQRRDVRRRSILVPSRGGTRPRLPRRRRMDFLLGPSDLARAIRGGGRPRLAPDYCLHVNEVTLALAATTPLAQRVEVDTRFDRGPSAGAGL